MPTEENSRRLEFIGRFLRCDDFLYLINIDKRTDKLTARYAERQVYPVPRGKPREQA